MKSYMFNKPTPIIYYANPQTIIKLRNISKIMRKRVFHALRSKIVLTRKREHKEAAKINGKYSFRMNSHTFAVTEPSKMQKNLNSYIIRRNEDYDILTKINDELNCSLNLAEQPKGEWTIEKSNSLFLSPDNYKLYSKVKIDTLYRLMIQNYATTEKIKTVQIHFSVRFIKSVNFNNVTVSKELADKCKTVTDIAFRNCVLEDNLYFPNVLTLTSNRTEGISKLIVPKLRKLVLEESEADTELNDWIYSLKGLKELNHKGSYLKISSIPEKIMHYSSNYTRKSEIDLIYSRFPNLVKIDLPNSSLEFTSFKHKALKHIISQLSYNTSKTADFRLREAVIDDDSVLFFSEQPELLEKCCILQIKTKEFNLKNLPVTVKILLLNQFEDESKVLNRFRG